MEKNKIIQDIKLKIIVIVLSVSLILSGMNIADAVPSGAKQYGSKTATKMKTAEIKQDIPKSAEKKTTSPKNHKGLQFEVKDEKLKVEKKLIEQQKAQEKISQMYYKNPYKPPPTR